MKYNLSGLVIEIPRNSAWVLLWEICSDDCRTAYSYSLAAAVCARAVTFLNNIKKSLESPFCAEPLRPFLASPSIGFVQVVIHQDDDALYRDAIEGLVLPDPVYGGAERHLSALRGLESLETHAPKTVLIHDAARPFVDQALIERVINLTKQGQGAIPALPVSDTLKRVDSEGFIEATVDRSSLWRAQTPQGFEFSDILRAHQMRGTENPTDDAALFETAGGRVVIVLGEERNIKVTAPKDF